MGGGNRAKEQAKRAEEQAKAVKKERQRAEAERARIESENQQKSDARKRAALGRNSLIRNSGGELGIKDELG